MSSKQTTTSDPHSLAFYALSPLSAFYEWYSSKSPEEAEAQMHEPPYIVSAGFGVSIISQIRAFIWNDGMVQKGYEEHKDGIFKMPQMGTWINVVSGKYLDEVLRAPESSLSFQEVLNDGIQLEHLIGPALSRDQIHLPLIKMLIRNLDMVHTEIADETLFAIEHELSSKGKIKDGWTAIKCTDIAYYSVLRLNLRTYVGLPLCREDTWIKALDKDAMDFALRTWVLRIFPRSKRESAAIYLSRFGLPFRAATARLGEIIHQRLAIPEEERPNNLLTWILARFAGEEPDVQLISGVFQLITMVSQNTTSMTLGHALFYLVANPECIEILREELQEVLNGSDITYESLDRMHKLDSFIRETQRLTPLGNLSITRIALKDFIFSDGTLVPAGQLIHGIAAPIHHDSAHYDEPLAFKPWRFSEMTQAEVDEGSTSARMSGKYDIVQPSKSFMIWGLGKHACPGRWYAAMVIKHLMAYILLNYDIKLPDSARGKRPGNIEFAGMHLPNWSAKILFKRREEK